MSSRQFINRDFDLPTVLGFDALLCRLLQQLKVDIDKLVIEVVVQLLAELGVLIKGEKSVTFLSGRLEIGIRDAVMEMVDLAGAPLLKAALGCLVVLFF